MDLALQTSVLGVKTLHSTAEVRDNNYDKGIGVRAGGGCARNDCRCARRRNTECQWVFPIPVT